MRLFDLKGQGLDSYGRTVYLGDSKPSKFAVKWHRHGRYQEFPQFKTVPQQDMKEGGVGIKIHPATDRRAQPWKEIVRANIHKQTVECLPSTEAGVEEVREWIYLVLIQQKNKFADKRPWLVSTTLNNWEADGKKLRQMTDVEWSKICPETWITVYNEVVRNSSRHRRAVAMALTSDISSLLEKEKSPSMNFSTEKEEVSGKAKTKWYRRFFCFGDLNEVEEQLPAYEKTGLPEYMEKAALPICTEVAELA